MKFLELETSDNKQIIDYLSKCMITGGKSGEAQSFDIAIGIINNPRNLNNQELINELQVLIPFYEKPSVASSQSQLLRVIGLFLRIFHQLN